LGSVARTRATCFEGGLAGLRGDAIAASVRVHR
jgi:hypothetical protein